MSLKAYFINSSEAEYTDAEFAWFQTLFLTEGVIGDVTGVIGLEVTENDTPDMSVLISEGKALVEVEIDGRVLKVVVESDAEEQKTIAANTSGSNRVDAVIVRVDKDVEPNTLKTNVATIEVVTGSGVSALADAAIDTAVGDDGWYRLANVTVVDSETTILDADIADTRAKVSTNAAMDVGNGVPVGSVQEFASDILPAGWLWAHGDTVSRATYANLFAAIGEKYGAGDGATTFTLPDRRGKFAMGVDTTKKTVIEDCEDAWNESTAANVTSSVDSVVKKTGTNSVKLAVGSAVAAGTILATEVIASTDIRRKSHIHLWIRSTVNASSGDLQLLLDDTANCASPVYTLNVPALTANVWKRVSIPIPVISEATTGAPTQALISIGLKMVTDLGAFDVNIDDICVGNAFELGISGGEEDHTLIISETPAHGHTTNAVTSPNSGGGGGSSSAPATTASINSTGGGQGHNNIPPYVAQNFIIKY